MGVETEMWKVAVEIAGAKVKGLDDWILKDIPEACRYKWPGGVNIAFFMR